MEKHEALVTQCEIWLESQTDTQKNALRQLMSFRSLKPEKPNIKVSDGHPLGVSFSDAFVQIGYERIPLIQEIHQGANTIYVIHPVLFNLLSSNPRV